MKRLAMKIMYRLNHFDCEFLTMEFTKDALKNKIITVNGNQRVIRTQKESKRLIKNLERANRMLRGWSRSLPLE